MTQEAKLYKMSDLVRLSGVSKQTIHFYLREGLLLPPIRTSKNMAYYDESTVDDIRFIKELQEKYYLPLAVIKEILKAKREGQDLGEKDHLLMFNQLFLQARKGGSDEHFDEDSFLAKTGLTKKELHQLSLIGIISQPTETENRLFDGFDLAIARALKELITMGLDLEDLMLYGDFLRLSRREAELVHDRIFNRYAGEKHQPLKEIQIRLEKVKSLLTAKAYREFFINHRHHYGTEKGGN
ncbi:predicted transcriptional regulator [Pelotomaculum thermopropionicum SI]|uniref:Predicted transcriptional regulator n=1 Tax=Pelotomaculum thermopropionicum (strain DSM 13744 / JCM 10971 / SI) TaxID=370438 RepID=A5CYQ1_PELTS|nr:predicted transcriptional regulator [Pelotomaculum thermopropionicum SI]